MREKKKCIRVLYQFHFEKSSISYWHWRVYVFRHKISPFICNFELNIMWQKVDRFFILRVKNAHPKYGVTIHSRELIKIWFFVVKPISSNLLVFRFFCSDFDKKHVSVEDEISESSYSSLLAIISRCNIVNGW